MYELMRDNGRFSLEISKIISFRLKKTERRLERLLFKDAKTRLLEFIQDLVEEQAASTKDAVEINHFYTQNDIANLIGTSRETVTKLLNQFKQEGILEYSRRTITIYNKEAFSKLSSL